MNAKNVIITRFVKMDVSEATNLVNILHVVAKTMITNQNRTIGENIDLN